jgi:hypothetical protein
MSDEKRYNIPLTQDEIALIITALKQVRYGNGDIVTEAHWLSKDILARLKNSG